MPLPEQRPCRSYCEQCRGDLLIGRFGVVCERGCAIFHNVDEAYLRRTHPERVIQHAPFHQALKEIGDGVQRMRELNAPP